MLIIRARRGSRSNGASETPAKLARAAQERGELDPEIDPVHIGRLLIALVQGLLIQYAVYDGHVDVDAYVRTAVRLVDVPR